jgi:hypothetical protein
MFNSMREPVASMIVASLLAFSSLSAIATEQQAASGGQQAPTEKPAAGGGERQGRGQGGGGRGPGTTPLNLDDRSGFSPIFDGTMKNWDGDPALWKAENGMLVGETTATNALKENSFVIWRGGETADFELKVEFRMNSTNSGIQFRSQHLPQGSKQGNQEIAGKWVLKGYQADIDFANQYTGMIYEERGRGFLTQPKEPRQAVYLAADGTKQVIGHLERNPDELKAIVKPGDWNYVHLIARGNTIVNIVNGHVTALIVDDDAKARSLKGLLGFQIHVGPPMKIEFRNIALKKL